MFPAAVSFEEFCSLFQREKDCMRVLFESKWPDGFRCPKCAHTHAYMITTRTLPLYQCSSCDAQTSLIASTIFQGTRTPLRLWFQAIYLHARPEGVNALQLSRIIKVTYKTAWLICHKLRHAMQKQNEEEFLTGVIRITDAKLCTRTTASSAWHQQEQSVLVGASVDEQGQVTRLKIQKQNKQLLKNRYESPPTEPFIREHLDRTVTEPPIISRNYFGKRDYLLLGLAQKAQQRLADIFRGVGEKHLQVYLDQFCYAWNRRSQSIFEQLLRACAVTSTITYPQLIGRHVNRTQLVPWTATFNKTGISKAS
ncbi:transposase [Cohnella pontilimi]|uniref:Transposase n=2 Tax=Cohnella pontilimi TaxID=2564100 RepID=A0A4U0FBE6_9BACL|nr:transposase [Cohnella pontilimi]